MWAAAGGGTGRRGEGEVASEMAVLRNFSEREQKESEGDGGALLLDGRLGTSLFSCALFPFLLYNWQNS